MALLHDTCAWSCPVKVLLWSKSPSGDGSSGTSALVSVLLRTPVAAIRGRQDFLRARWAMAGSDLAGEVGEVGTAVMPSWP